MTKLFSLFSTQKEATDAIDVLISEMDDLKTEVIEAQTEVAVPDTKVAAANPLPGAPGAPIITTADSKIDELAMNDEAARFYKRGVENGGVMVIVEADDEQADDVRRILREENGRTPKQVSS